MSSSVSCLARAFREGILAILTVMAVGPTLHGQVNAYNPYADSQESLPPVAPDGTLRWGTFYKSAALQKAYERLWNLGACRGTNKAITVPVEMNKVAIDSLPEEEFRGVVVGTAGTLHGGMLAFTPSTPGTAEPPTLVAALHPAGVSTLSVSGRMDAMAIRPGMTVRLRTRVDRKGVSLDPVTAIDVITPGRGSASTPVQPHQPTSVIATVTRVQADRLSLNVATGTIRRLSVTLAPDAIVNVDAAQLDLVSPGDVVLLVGRVWRGDGCMGDGTVFASRVTVTKPGPADGQHAPAAAERIGATGTSAPGGF